MANLTSTSKSIHQRKSPENRILDHLDRVKQARSGWFAVIIHLSKLRTHNRQPYHIRIAVRSFDTQIFSSEVELQLLTLGDLVVIFKSHKSIDVDRAINRVRKLFQSDPLTKLTKSSNQDEFVTFYDLKTNYEELREKIKESEVISQDLCQISDKSFAEGDGSVEISGQYFDPLALTKVENSLNPNLISDMFQKQAAAMIGAHGTERVLFFENYISIKELQRQLAPKYNLSSSIWLFHYLTQSIDKCLLQTFMKRDFAKLSHKICLNLNIRSILGGGFQHFDKSVAGDTEKLIVGLRQIDVFSDIAEFKAARNLLRDRGYGMLLDGLNPNLLRIVNPSELDVDYYKVGWDYGYWETASARDQLEIESLINSLDVNRIILSGTDSETAISWALKLGIRQFQGYFIDSLIDRQLARGKRLGPDDRSSQLSN